MAARSQSSTVSAARIIRMMVAFTSSTRTGLPRGCSKVCFPSSLKFRTSDTNLSDPLPAVKLVHKSPPLDLVGWYALVPKGGPLHLHLAIHRQITALNESAVLLGFHLEDMVSPTAGDPLPVTIYESNIEVDGEDQEMRDSENPTTMVLRFRKLPYAIETGEAEMIAMQFIREGGANAAVEVASVLDQFDKKIAVDDGRQGKRRAVAAKDSKGKGKQKEESPAEAAQAAAANNPDANLSKVEAEYMSALQAKFNATKMLKSRLDLIIRYLSRLPPGFTDGTETTAQAAENARASGGQYTIPNNNILRHINALVTNYELVTPTERADLQKEILQETNDVNLVSLVADLLASVDEVREVGRKSAVIEQYKGHAGRRGYGAGGGPGPGSAVADLM